MIDTRVTASPQAVAWTCPFCPLACDQLGVRIGGACDDLALAGGECERASLGLAQFRAQPCAVTAMINGQGCDLSTAVAAAARMLGNSRQPLFGGLCTDVAGARALYPLACATGAICDPGAGAALMQGLRALQDSGQFTTTLAEVRTRADLIVFVGDLPTDLAPLIAQRCGIGDAQVPRRHIVVLGPGAGDIATLAEWATASVRASARLSAPLQSMLTVAPASASAESAARAEVTVEALPLQGDLFDTLSLLSLLVERPAAVPEAAPALRALAQRLLQARYAVLIAAPARLPAHGALLVEAVHRVVGSLNRSTRAAALWIGGGNGAASVNQVFTWLSGLPLRTRLAPAGLEHEPLLFDAARLLADGAVDALLWISCFDAQMAPPPTTLPMVVLGHPALAAGLGERQAEQARRGEAATTVFIPVSTPGIGSAGHLFRTDGTVLMPLHQVVADTLPTLDRVLGNIAVQIRSGEVCASNGAPV